MRCLRQGMVWILNWFSGTETSCSACGKVFDGSNSDPTHRSVCCDCFEKTVGHSSPAFEAHLSRQPKGGVGRQTFTGGNER